MASSRGSGSKGEMNQDRVHFIGIGGSGMSSIARIMIAQGRVVSGSDQTDSNTTHALRQLGAQVLIGHHPENLPKPPGMVVITSAIRPENPELIAARQLGFTVVHRSEALAALMDGYRRICVTGTAGKSSTAAMLVSGLLNAGIEPTYAIGAVLNSTGSGALVGTDDVFVAEADESDGSLSNYAPNVALVTNVRADHLDYFGTEEAYVATFRKMVETIRPGGVLIVCADDAGAADLGLFAESYGVTARRYGKGRADLDLVMLECQPFADGCCAQVQYKGERFSLVVPVPGEHMAVNALGAILAGVEIGASVADMAGGIVEFGGVQRRFELKGIADGISVYDDYAHHPMKVEAQLRAAREVLSVGSGQPGRLIVVFQPHMYSRTLTFAKEFGSALALADEVVLLDIYGAREDPIPGVTSKLVADTIRLPPGRVHLRHENDVLPLLLEIAHAGDMIITMGAGSVTNIGPTLVAALSRRERR
jgi:UDP-N-acetylmuramate--alanine ligase